MPRRPEEEIGSRFLSKRRPPPRRAWVIFALMQVAFAVTVVLFAIGHWQPGIVAIFGLGVFYMWARGRMLP